MWKISLLFDWRYSYGETVGKLGASISASLRPSLWLSFQFRIGLMWNLNLKAENYMELITGIILFKSLKLLHFLRDFCFLGSPVDCFEHKQKFTPLSRKIHSNSEFWMGRYEKNTLIENRVCIICSFNFFLSEFFCPTLAHF